MTKRKSKNAIEKMSLTQRIIVLISGITGLIFLFIYSYKFTESDIFISFFGYNITTYAFAGLIIIVGIMFSSLFKSGLRGKWSLD